MIKKMNIKNCFIIFIILHLFIWTLIPSITNKNLPLDTIEALAWGSNLDWGYIKHPPVSALIIELFYKIFSNQDWAYYLLSQILVIISFIYVYKLSNQILKNELYAILSVLVLEGIIFFNYTTPEFNVYVAQLPFKALVIYYCWKCINENKVLNWFLLGVFSGIGFLTHYSFIFLLISIKLLFLFKILNDKKFDYKYFIPGIVFLLIISPHLFWLIENNFTTIRYALGRANMDESSFINHLINPMTFILKQIGILIPLFFMILLICSFRVNFKKTDKQGTFLIFCNIVPLFLVLLTSVIFGAKIRTMWMSTFYLFFGLFFIYYLKSKINIKKLGKFFFVFIFIFLLSPMTYMYVSVANEFKRTDYPGKEIADLVQRKWDKNFINEISVVVGDEWAAGNLSYHLKSRPVWYNELKNKSKSINNDDGIIYAGNPKILKKICPGEFGTIKPVGYCMIGRK